MDGQALLTRVELYRREGWRLVMINATPVKPGPEVPEGSCDLMWSFEREGRLEHLKERVTAADPVPSISGLYAFAFLYENELKELFGLDVQGMNVDFKGQLYRTATKVPLSPKAIRQRLEAAAAAKAAAGKGKQP